MNVLQRTGWAIRRWLGQTAVKAADNLVFLPTWVRYTFRKFGFDAVVTDGYKGNATAYACFRILSDNFSEPPLYAYEEANGQEVKIANHPLRVLMKKPNSDMGEAEFLSLCIIYASLSGNVYLWKQRDGNGRVMALWPYSDGDMTPVPGRSSAEGIVAYYVLDVGEIPEGSTNPWGIARHDTLGGIAIPKSEIIHYKWMIDPSQPWIGVGALEAAAKDVDTANEVRAFIFSLLKNNATPPLVINLPEGNEYDENRANRLRKQWQIKYGGENRGLPAFLEYGMNVTQLGFDLQQLEIESLRDGPDAAICMGFGISPMIVGAIVGLDRSTFSNYAEARKALVQDTLIPRWRSFASEVEQAMMDEPGFDESVIIRFDISKIAALQDDVDAVWQRVNEAWKAGLLTRGEAREAMGYEAGPNDVVYLEALNTLLTPAKGLPVIRQNGRSSNGRLLLPPGKRSLEMKGHTGIMVAFMIPLPELALGEDVLPDGSVPTSVDELHLTLTFLGDSMDTAVDKSVLAEAVARFASAHSPIAGRLNGTGRFMNGDNNQSAYYANFDSKDLPAFRQELVEALADAGIVSPSEHGFIPHITLAYIPQDAPAPMVALPVDEIVLSEVAVVWAGERMFYALQGNGEDGQNGRSNPDRKAAPDADKFFDYGYARRLKEDWPEIWEMGGNIRGNDVFELWTRWRDGERTETIEYWIDTERPAWGARHHENFRVAGVVAQIKWGWVGTLGVAGMKAVIEEEKERLSKARWHDWKLFPDGTEGAGDRRATRAQLERVRDSVVALRGLRVDLEPEMAGDLDRYFAGWGERAETAVLESFKQMVPVPVNGRVGGVPELKALTEAEWLQILNLMMGHANEAELQKLIEEYQIKISEEAWGTFNLMLNAEVAFDLTNPAVTRLLGTAGQRVRNITDSTRGQLQELLQYGNENGWAIEDFVRGDSVKPGIRNFITETYKNRSRAIARTELGTAQQMAAVGRYAVAGVEEVIVFDNGFSNSHPACVKLAGTIQTLAWAEQNPLQHPNCVRAFGPYFRD